MRGAETRYLIQFDVGILRLRHGGTGDPPVRAGQSGGQIGSAPWLSMLPDAAGIRNNLAMCRLPKPDKARFLAEYDSVVPPPYHRLSAVRPDRDSY